MSLSARIEPTRKRVGGERGSSVIESLLALGLVLLVVVLIVQGVAYVHARSVAQTAAQEGARRAAVDGTGAGGARARDVLRAAGGTGARLSATASESATTVTVSVAGSAPRVFPVGLIVPDIRARASLPLERFPAEERRP
jgi:hypothetical protein